MIDQRSNYELESENTFKNFSVLRRGSCAFVLPIFLVSLLSTKFDENTNKSNRNKREKTIVPNLCKKQ